MTETEKAELERLRALEGRLRFVLEHLHEIAYDQISNEHVLTIMPLSRHRAHVPRHWQDAADTRARPYRHVIEDILNGEDI